MVQLSLNLTHVHVSLVPRSINLLGNSQKLATLLRVVRERLDKVMAICMSSVLMFTREQAWHVKPARASLYRSCSLAWPDPFSTGHLSIRDYKRPLWKGLVHFHYTFSQRSSTPVYFIVRSRVLIWHANNSRSSREFPTVPRKNYETIVCLLHVSVKFKLSCTVS